MIQTNNVIRYNPIISIISYWLIGKHIYLCIWYTRMCLYTYVIFPRYRPSFATLTRICNIKQQGSLTRYKIDQVCIYVLVIRVCVFQTLNFEILRAIDTQITYITALNLNIFFLIVCICFVIIRLRWYTICINCLHYICICICIWKYNSPIRQIYLRINSIIQQIEEKRKERNNNSSFVY